MSGQHMKSLNIVFPMRSAVSWYKRAFSCCYQAIFISVLPTQIMICEVKWDIRQAGLDHTHRALRPLLFLNSNLGFLNVPYNF